MGWKWKYFAQLYDVLLQPTYRSPRTKRNSRMKKRWSAWASACGTGIRATRRCRCARLSGVEIAALALRRMSVPFKFGQTRASTAPGSAPKSERKLASSLQHGAGATVPHSKTHEVEMVRMFDETLLELAVRLRVTVYTPVRTNRNTRCDIYRGSIEYSRPPEGWTWNQESYFARLSLKDFLKLGSPKSFDERLSAIRDSALGVIV